MTPTSSVQTPSSSTHSMSGTLAVSILTEASKLFRRGMAVLQEPQGASLEGSKVTDLTRDCQNVLDRDGQSQRADVLSLLHRLVGYLACPVGDHEKLCKELKQWVKDQEDSDPILAEPLSPLLMKNRFPASPPLPASPPRSAPPIQRRISLADLREPIRQLRARGVLFNRFVEAASTDILWSFHPLNEQEDRLCNEEMPFVIEVLIARTKEYASKSPPFVRLGALNNKSGELVIELRRQDRCSLPDHEVIAPLILRWFSLRSDRPRRLEALLRDVPSLGDLLIGNGLQNTLSGLVQYLSNSMATLIEKDYLEGVVPTQVTAVHDKAFNALTDATRLFRLVQYYPRTTSVFREALDKRPPLGNLFWQYYQSLPDLSQKEWMDLFSLVCPDQGLRKVLPCYLSMDCRDRRRELAPLLIQGAAHHRDDPDFQPCLAAAALQILFREHSSWTHWEALDEMVAGGRNWLAEQTGACTNPELGAWILTNVMTLLATTEGIDSRTQADWVVLLNRLSSSCGLTQTLKEALLSAKYRGVFEAFCKHQSALSRF
ncbi:MAG: hypothetical protein ACOYKZ_08005 [Chlamydiia bacterium]